MATADAEDTPFVGDDGPTELWNRERVLQRHFVTELLIHIEKVERFASPLKVVDELVRAI